MTHRTSDSPTCSNMEGNKQSTVKQNQAGDDSGYSCTSTQYSQSASSGDSCFDEQRPTTLESAENGKHSTLKSNEQQSQTTLKNASGLETTSINQESKNKDLKSEEKILTKSEPQTGQSFSTSTNDKNHSSSTSEFEVYESKNINEETSSDHEQKNSNFLHLANLYQSYHDHKSKETETSNSNHDLILKDSVIKEVNDQEILLKEIIESNEVHDDLFGVIVSMNDGLIIDTSNSIHKNMGYPKDMCQGRSFVDFIHPNDRSSFISYVTSVLTDPYTVSKQDGTSSVTFLKSKNNDGFYCNMQRYGSLNNGFLLTQKKNHYQVCKLTTTFKDLSYVSVSSSHLANQIKISPRLILIVNAQLVHSAYKHPEEILESPVNFVTKHNELFEWCYVDHLIISHTGYLPQNIIGRSIFSYFKYEDITKIKEVHKNIIRDKSISYMGKPYRFKCQNGDFALIQTEWSNFVNPWSGKAEFFIGKHKVIQGPINPDVTTPVTGDEKYSNIIIKNTLNKNTYEADQYWYQLNNTTNLDDNNKQISKKIENSGMNCLVKNINASIQVPLEVEVQPETCGSFSDHDSVMFGEISPHHNYENKSSSETPPSYTQLNYDNNIQRFFDSDLKTNSIENLADLKESARDIDTPSDIEMDNALSEKFFHSLNPNSRIFINNFFASYSGQNSSSSQQPLTQNILFRHNKIMEDELVKQHKNNAKKNKSNEKSKLNVPDEIENIIDIVHGIKRRNSSENENENENDSCKHTKIKHFVSSNTTVVMQTDDNEDIVVVTPTHTVSKATQIWQPCQVTRYSQTTNDLLRLSPDLPTKAHYYNLPLGNNLMPMNLNEFESTSSLMGSYDHNQGPISNKLQPSAVQLYATISDQIPQNSEIVQPYLYYNNQLLLKQTHQNIQFKDTVNSQIEYQVPAELKVFHQKPEDLQTLQVNQEEVITSSDSEYKREFNSLKSSSGCMFSYENSSFYSSSLCEKTDSSDREDWPSDFNKINLADQLSRRKPFWMENIESTPDLIYRYQIKLEDINKVLQRDLDTLKTFTQPSLVNEQLRQLCMEMNVDKTKTDFEDATTFNTGEDEFLNMMQEY